MNWGREALDLYEKNLNKVGKIEYRGEFPYTLLPTFHSTATAQITVTIDEEGNFYMANRFLQMINLPLFRLQKNQEAEHLEKKPSPV